MASEKQEQQGGEVLNLFKIRIEDDFEAWSQKSQEVDDSTVELVVIKKNLKDDGKMTGKSF